MPSGALDIYKLAERVQTSGSQNIIGSTDSLLNIKSSFSRVTDPGFTTLAERDMGLFMGEELSGYGFSLNNHEDSGGQKFSIKEISSSGTKEVLSCSGGLLSSNAVSYPITKSGIANGTFAEEVGFRPTIRYNLSTSYYVPANAHPSESVYYDLRAADVIEVSNVTFPINGVNKTFVTNYTAPECKFTLLGGFTYKIIFYGIMRWNNYDLYLDNPYTAHDVFRLINVGTNTVLSESRINGIFNDRSTFKDIWTLRIETFVTPVGVSEDYKVQVKQTPTALGVNTVIVYGNESADGSCYLSIEAVSRNGALPA